MSVSRKPTPGLVLAQSSHHRSACTHHFPAQACAALGCAKSPLQGQPRAFSFSQCHNHHREARCGIGCLLCLAVSIGEFSGGRSEIYLKTCLSANTTLQMLASFFELPCCSHHLLFASLPPPDFSEKPPKPPLSLPSRCLVSTANQDNLTKGTNGYVSRPTF